MRKILTILTLITFVLTGCSSSNPATKNQVGSTSSDAQKIFYDNNDEEISNFIKKYYEVAYNTENHSNKDLNPYYLPFVKEEDYSVNFSRLRKLKDLKIIALAQEETLAVVETEYSFNDNKDGQDYLAKYNDAIFLEKSNNQWLIKNLRHYQFDTIEWTLSEKVKKQIANPKWIKLNNETLQGLGVSDVQTVRKWTNSEEGRVMNMGALGKINNHVYHIETSYVNDKLTGIHIYDLNFKEIQKGEENFKLDLSKY